MFGGGSPDGMFQGDQGKAMEASFKEFLNRPENRPLLEAQQRKEMRQALRVQEQMRGLEFREKVLDSDIDVQRSLAPFLKYRALRRVIQTFGNDPRGDLAQWATNPRVLAMLAQAKQMLDEGVMTDDEMEARMVSYLRHPSNPSSAAFEAAARPVARLPTEQLVGALNEHLSERRRGNDAYRSGDLRGAVEAYTRARAVVELVRGLSSADQAEVDANRVAVNLNLAAAHLALKEFGTAASFCDSALELEPRNPKALLRRARANAGRHELAAARADLAAAAALGGAAARDAAELSAELDRREAEGREADLKAFRGMLAGHTGGGSA